MKDFFTLNDTTYITYFIDFKYISFINLKLSWINKILLHFDGFNVGRFAVISKPAEENARSDVELVIGMA
jgi:hypothetical protein